MALPISDFPDYTIDEKGNIWSNKTNKYLKPYYNKLGYASVELFNKNGSKRISIHRLVAITFIPNPHNYPQVNHKDENPSNNNVENLEWCTAKYNMNYGEGAKTRHKKIDYTKSIYAINARNNGKKVCRRVFQLSADGKVINEFESAVEASKKTGIYKTNITRSARSSYLKAGGYKWEYEI